MKLITQLTGATADGDFREPRGIVSAIHDQPAPGVLRAVTLGGAGLVFKRADVRVAIPLDELWKLAETAEPRLAASAAELSPDARATAATRARLLGGVK